MKPRCHVFLFASQFAPLVEHELKGQTVRPRRKRVVQVGDLLDLRAWTGKPYRSKQRRLLLSPCIETREIAITVDRIVLARNTLSPGEREAFARADGFGSWEDLRLWFANTHGLPFHGTLYRWKPINHAQQTITGAPAV